MAWVSATALRLDRSQAEARAQAELEEKVHLALWRMDFMLSPLPAQESARPSGRSPSFEFLDEQCVLRTVPSALGLV
jgi:hypothetical protein